MEIGPPPGIPPQCGPSMISRHKTARRPLGPHRAAPPRSASRRGHDSQGQLADRRISSDSGMPFCRAAETFSGPLSHLFFCVPLSAGSPTIAEDYGQSAGSTSSGPGQKRVVPGVQAIEDAGNGSFARLKNRSVAPAACFSSRGQTSTAEPGHHYRERETKGRGGRRRPIHSPARRPITGQSQVCRCSPDTFDTVDDLGRVRPRSRVREVDRGPARRCDPRGGTQAAYRAAVSPSPSWRSRMDHADFRLLRGGICRSDGAAIAVLCAES